MFRHAAVIITAAMPFFVTISPLDMPMYFHAFADVFDAIVAMLFTRHADTP